MNTQTRMDQDFEELGRLAQESRARLGTSAVGDDLAVPVWESMVPPDPLSPDQLIKFEREGRKDRAGQIRSQLPDYFARSTIEDLTRRIHAEHFRKLALSWDPRTHGNALILGETGQGKSTASAVLYRRLLADGWRNGGPAWDLAQGLQWHRVEALERSVREWPLGKGTAPAYAAAVGASVLVLDDLGWEKDEKLVASIMAERYESPGLTICTSGMNREELTARYGAAVVRRMLSHQNRPHITVEAFPSNDLEKDKARAMKPKPPGDQEVLAARMGETL